MMILNVLKEKFPLLFTIIMRYHYNKYTPDKMFSIKRRLAKSDIKNKKNKVLVQLLANFSIQFLLL